MHTPSRSHGAADSLDRPRSLRADRIRRRLPSDTTAGGTGPGRERLPRSSRYDPAWLLGLDMGPHPLWLLEDQAQEHELRQLMINLDMGTGNGATSVF
ncbi:hypothetical protein ACFULU_35600, partial [Streptomyces sp. NPDC057284]